MAHPPDKQQDRSGWDTVDPGNRPPLDALRVTPERAGHILDGDASGRGGHRHGVGNPGKTEFPASWDDKKIMDNVHDIARRPDQPPIYQAWNSRWLARGTRDDVEVVVVVASDGRIWSGWPRRGGRGLVRTPRRPDEKVGDCAAGIGFAGQVRGTRPAADLGEHSADGGGWRIRRAGDRAGGIARSAQYAGHRG